MTWVVGYPSPVAKSAVESARDKQVTAKMAARAFLDPSVWPGPAILGLRRSHPLNGVPLVLGRVNETNSRVAVFHRPDRKLTAGMWKNRPVETDFAIS